MKRKLYKRSIAILLGICMAAQPPAAVPGPLHSLNAYAYTGAATVKASSLNVRSGAGTGYSAVGRLAAGASIQILGETTGTDGVTWYQIQYTGSGGNVGTGYVSSKYVRLPVTYSKDTNFESYLTSQGFPESYKEGLRQLHAQYPNWVFVAKNTGLDWNTVIENETLLGRNLVSAGSVSSWKSVKSGAYNWDNSTWTGFDGSNWVAASDDIVRYYMDPRNFLDETFVFQFLSHEYNSSIQTREGLEKLVEGTFLSGSAGTSQGGSYSGGPSAGSSSGPGVSGSSSSGTVTKKGPGRSQGADQDVNHGPGVSGSSSSANGGSSSSGPSSGSSGSQEVKLEAPHASITPKGRGLVATSVSLTAPGSESTSQPAQSSGSGTSVMTGAAPGSGSGTPTGAPAGSTGAAGTTVSYVDVIMNAAAQSGVSPYVLAAMILQEQGKQGTSPLISGNYSGYQGYYNFFNVEAYQSGSMSAIQMGLRYASQSGSYGRPWNTAEKSIIGGAQNYGDNYVKAGQNTFYLKKFNVQGSNLYKHQYMSNIQGAASEAEWLSKAYGSLKGQALEFHIPVYNNMPSAPCTAPTGDGSPNNKLSGLSVDGFSLTPSFGKDTESYSLIVGTSVNQLQINASAADSKASVSGTGTVAIPNAQTDLTVRVRAENGTERTYTIHVVRQEGGPTAGAQTGTSGSSQGTVTVTPGGSAGSSGGPGSPASNHQGPGGSNVTIVQVQ